MASYVVGIDLGTTHCAVASVDAQKGKDAQVVDFPIPQLVAAGEIGSKPLLPSFLYLPSEVELPESALRLPWSADVDRKVVGEFARWQGARVPGRLVSSAKSWLCHPGVDRSAPILPWGAPADVPKVSPVEASAQLLSHMAKAWDAAHPSQPLSAQEVVVTVPASFDEAARALTVSAIRKAGIEKFTLLEEPQAAFYDFTARHRAELSKSLEGVRLVLVVDVGGGTTDFTLVHVGVSPEGPVMRRLAVGEHLMLGGDNMDAALAKLAEEKLSASGKRLSATQWTQLLQASRSAKEALLSNAPPEKYGVSLVNEGSRLLGGSLSAELSREETQRLLLEGFFPSARADEGPRKSSRIGIQELGLPYAQDPAVTRHLVAFLREHAAAGWTAIGGSEASARTPGSASGAAAASSGAPGKSHPASGPTPLPRPDAILLNGGVFNSPQISARLVDAVSSLWPDQPKIKLLQHSSLELAVARGAAFYGLVRKGFGLKIGGGAARAFYVGIRTEEGRTQAVCLIPRGFDEGASVDLGTRPFTLTLGRPVQFPLFSSSSDRIDKPGDLIDVSTEQFRPLPPIHTVLKSGTGKTGEVPVHLSATLTEIGTLELFCVANDSDERWRLEFELRGATAAGAVTITESMPARFKDAVEEIVRIYG
ncbi:MAG: Hsp70 family protein, partial [Myxococcaceae bacterium]